MRLENINIRDPFVLPVAEEHQYYLFGTTACNGHPGFDCYISADLKEWSEPQAVFRPTADFWGQESFWAAECHAWKGNYYLFGTFTRKAPLHRGTQILRSVSGTPKGPYVPISDGPITPKEWLALDGTLYVEDGKPWMVFCHEWVQLHDGTVCAMPLADDLTAAGGAPITLFAGSAGAWVARGENYVTDGAFLFHDGAGRLCMLWSSFTSFTANYAMGMAVSESGRVAGPWRQCPAPLYARDGGHGMRFQSFNGKWHYTLHAPNHPGGAERALIIDA